MADDLNCDLCGQPGRTKFCDRRSDAMADLRSGLCHGPNCQAKITEGGESEDFCSDLCQMAWHARHALPQMPVVEVNMPSSSMARWTPEGGAPVTPETSTWEPVTVGGFERVTGALPFELRPGDLIVVEGGLSAGRYRVAEPTGPTSYNVMPDDEEPEAGEAATQSPPTHGALLADLDEGICIECGRLRYEHHGRHCLPKRSWLSRIWRYIHG